MTYLIYIGTVLLIAVLYVLTTIGPILWKFYRVRRALLREFPGPSYHWLRGHLSETPGQNEKGLRWNNVQVSKYPRYYVLIYGPVAVLQLNHPETIKQLTKTTEPKPFSFGGPYRLLLPWIGDGLLLSSGNKWFRNRKLLTPGFHFDVLKPYIDIYNAGAEILIERFDKESSNPHKSIDIFKLVSYYTLDIILRCAFSSKQEIQKKVENQTYARTVHELGKQITERVYQLLWHFDSVYYFTKQGKKFRKNCDYSHKVAQDIMKSRTIELTDSDTIEKLSTKRYVDFLDILLLAKDEDGNGLTQQEIQDEVETFMFEGHDTTASGISWILYNLARHPDIQAKARDEVDSLLQDRATDTIVWDDMGKLPFVTRCIKESLRLHPPVPIVSREATQPLQMDDKLIPAGSFVDINIWNLHHNPTVWENPMTYDPDRFVSEKMAQMDSHAFMPFSAGPRNCIGQNFAMNEMKTTVARIIRRFELSVDTSQKVKMLPDVVMRSESGIHLFFKNRK